MAARFRRLILVIAACGAAYGEDILIVEHPAYRSETLNLNAATEVVPGLPIVLRAGVVNTTPASGPGGFSCLDPGTARAVLVRSGETEETGLTLVRDSSCQIDIQSRIPEGFPMGPAEAWFFDAAGRKYGPAKLAVVASKIGVLSRLDPTWKRMPASARLAADGQRITINMVQPARPGAIVELRVIGFGEADPGSLSVALGQDILSVSEAEPDPADPGVHLLRFTMPDEPSHQGCYVPLRIRTRSGDSNLTTLAVASGAGPCAHRLKLTEAEMARLEQGDTVPIGLVTIAWGSTGAWTSFNLRKADAELVADIAGLDEPAFSGCTISRNWAVEDRSLRQPFSTRSYLPLFTGPVTATAPEAQTITIGAIGVIPPLRPGEWMLRASGGSDVAPFERSFRVPRSWIPGQPRQIFGVESGIDAEVEWDASMMHEADTVTLLLFGNLTHRLRCEAPALEGKMRLDTAEFQKALAEATPPVRMNVVQYIVNADPKWLQPFRFHLANGSEAVGVISVSVANIYTNR